MTHRRDILAFPAAAWAATPGLPIATRAGRGSDAELLLHMAEWRIALQRCQAAAHIHEGATFNALVQAEGALLREIAATPAATSAGQRAKAEIIRHVIERDFPDEIEEGCLDEGLEMALSLARDLAVGALA